MSESRFRAIAEQARAGVARRHGVRARLCRDAAALARTRSTRRSPPGCLPAQFDEHFIELWRYYLMYCEGGFRGGGDRRRAGDVGQGGVMKRIILAAALALAGAATAQTVTITPDNAAQAAPGRRRGAVLEPGAARPNFPAMEKLFPGHVVKAGGKVRPLPAGQAAGDRRGRGRCLQWPSSNIAGLIVVQDGKVRLERYARGLWAGRALDQLLGRQVVHLDAGRRGDPRRLHQVGRRSGDALHPRPCGQRL